MELVEKIILPNRLTVEVWDKSRFIAADTMKVELYISMKVDLDPSYFIKHEHYNMVKKVFGPQIVFEHTMERAFVKNSAREATLQTLLESFKKDTFPYLSKPAFPRSFSLSKYWDIEKNRYKYQSFFQD
jgi:hypothetical protein